ncbi:MAG: hypothetical protein ACYSUT_10270 [Planctomycetota bacterium]|jgi:hypothetical protein
MADTNSNSQNLELIAIFHYVAAAIIYLKGLVSLFFIAIGAVVVTAVVAEEGPDPEVLVPVGIIFFMIPIFLLAIAAAIGTAVLVAGRRIARRVNLGYCQVVAGLECLCFPYGTVLGAITLYFLTRDDVKQQFKNGQ